MLTQEQLDTIDKIDDTHFNGLVGITFVEQSPNRSVAKMELREQLYQPFGFLHGGATLTLLEAVASRCAALRTDFTCERPFGIHIDVWHKNPGKTGTIYGIAELDHEEGTKQIWHVIALDNHDTVISEGTFMTKITPLSRLKEKGVSYTEPPFTL